MMPLGYWESQHNRQGSSAQVVATLAEKRGSWLRSCLGAARTVPGSEDVAVAEWAFLAV